MPVQVELKRGTSAAGRPYLRATFYAGPFSITAFVRETDGCVRDIDLPKGVEVALRDRLDLVTVVEEALSAPHAAGRG